MSDQTFAASSASWAPPSSWWWARSWSCSGAWRAGGPSRVPSLRGRLAVTLPRALRPPPAHPRARPPAPVRRHRRRHRPAPPRPRSPAATLTFVGLKLRCQRQRRQPATDHHLHQRRSPATIKAALATPTGDKIPTHMCLRAGTRDLGCGLERGTFTGRTTQAHTNWRVTLIGTNTVESPVVDLTVTFQAVAPKVRIVHARFDGTEGEPALNGIQVRSRATAPTATSGWWRRGAVTRSSTRSRRSTT